MTILYVEASQKIGVSENRFIFNDGEKETEISPHDISAIVIENTRTALTVKSFLQMDRYDILCIICDEKHYPSLSLMNQHKYYRLTTRITAQAAWSSRKKKHLAGLILSHKIHQQKNLLEKLYDDDASYLKNAIASLKAGHTHLQHEALAARIYFKKLFGPTFKRFADDITNQGLNYIYKCLSAFIAQVVLAKGLHPSIGFIHYSSFNNYNLVYDLIEVFRPMADHYVKKALKNHHKFDKHFKKALLMILQDTVVYEGRRVPIRHAVELYIDSIIAYFEHDRPPIFPIGVA